MKMTYDKTIFCRIIVDEGKKPEWNVIHKKSKLILGKIEYCEYLKQYILIPSTEDVIITFTQLKEICDFISKIR
jgi:hypothetical protein